MWNMGFGDSFLITLRQGTERWRALIDCGSLSNQTAPLMDETVSQIVSYLSDDDGSPMLDLVVATNRHGDHISGFANPAWDRVIVGEVWLPWVEDPMDAEATELQNELDAVVGPLFLLAGSHVAVGNETGGVWDTVATLAGNGRASAEAIERLSGRTPGFVEPDNVRYLFNDDDGATSAAAPFGGDGTVHVLGPSRNQAVFLNLNPPKSVEWLAGLDIGGSGSGSSKDELFDRQYWLSKRDLTDKRFSERLRPSASVRGHLKFASSESALVAATRAESWCNNASLFVVIDTGDKRLVFPGDTQHGGWMHVLDRPGSLALVTNPDLYKVSHHGSAAGTPYRFVDSLLGRGKYLMLAAGGTMHWPKIPDSGLLEAFDDQGHHLVRADDPKRATNNVTIAEDLSWSEVKF